MKHSTLPTPGQVTGAAGQELRMSLAHMVSLVQANAMRRGGTVPLGTYTQLQAMLTAAQNAITAATAVAP